MSGGTAEVLPDSAATDDPLKRTDYQSIPTVADYIATSCSPGTARSSRTTAATATAGTPGCTATSGPRSYCPARGSRWPCGRCTSGSTWGEPPAAPHRGSPRAAGDVGPATQGLPHGFEQFAPLHQGAAADLERTGQVVQRRQGPGVVRVCRSRHGFRGVRPATAVLGSGVLPLPGFTITRRLDTGGTGHGDRGSTALDLEERRGHLDGGVGEGPAVRATAGGGTDTRRRSTGVIARVSAGGDLGKQQRPCRNVIHVRTDRGDASRVGATPSAGTPGPPR